MNQSRPQLFILHFAGGNKYSFQFLTPHLTDKFDVIPLELPGRGKRMGEDLLSSRDLAVSDYVEQILARRNNQGFVIYGHSMGATLGRAVTNRLEILGDSPLALVVSGSAGPGAHEKKSRYLLSDEELIEELARMGGISDEVRGIPELLALFLPIIRADLEIIEKEEEEVRDILKLNTSITAIMGEEEESSEKITNWLGFSNSEVHTERLAGNHFFINDHPQTLARLIKDSYDRALVH